MVETNHKDKPDDDNPDEWADSCDRDIARLLAGIDQMRAMADDATLHWSFRLEASRVAVESCNLLTRTLRQIAAE